jgi:SAM-dependent methyltransferase
VTSPIETAPAPSSTATHWDEVHARTDPSLTSWFQRDPTMSLRLIASVTTPSSSVVDVGAGTSTLADRLLALGYRDVTLVDVSRVALDTAAARLAGAGAVHFVQADVLEWRTPRLYDVWHDRALFHFVLDPGAQRRYVNLAAATVSSGGAAVLGCFDPDGPASCSGLEVARYGVVELVDLFAGTFEFESSEREVHLTPAGVEQPFTWVVLRRS